MGGCYNYDIANLYHFMPVAGANTVAAPMSLTGVYSGVGFSNTSSSAYGSPCAASWKGNGNLSNNLLLGIANQLDGQSNNAGTSVPPTDYTTNSTPGYAASTAANTDLAVAYKFLRTGGTAMSFDIAVATTTGAADSKGATVQVSLNGTVVATSRDHTAATPQAGNKMAGAAISFQVPQYGLLYKAIYQQLYGGILLAGQGMGQDFSTQMPVAVCSSATVLGSAALCNALDAMDGTTNSMVQTANVLLAAFLGKVAQNLAEPKVNTPIGIAQDTAFPTSVVDRLTDSYTLAQAGTVNTGLMSEDWTAIGTAIKALDAGLCDTILGAVSGNALTDCTTKIPSTIAGIKLGGTDISKAAVKAMFVPLYNGTVMPFYQMVPDSTTGNTAYVFDQSTRTLTMWAVMTSAPAIVASLEIKDELRLQSPLKITGLKVTSK